MKETLICLGIDDHRIITEPDGKFSIRGSVNWSGKLKTYGRIPVTLHHIYGSFDISFNDLNSLDNAPALVMGVFDCSSNDIERFTSAPVVCHSLRAGNNPRLNDLEHAPLVVSGSPAHLEGTKTAAFAREVFYLACKSGTWNAASTWEENMKVLCKAEPSQCKKWPELHEHIIPHRGAAAGEDLGFL